MGIRSIDVKPCISYPCKEVQMPADGNFAWVPLASEKKKKVYASHEAACIKERFFRKERSELAKTSHALRKNPLISTRFVWVSTTCPSSDQDIVRAAGVASSLVRVQEEDYLIRDSFRDVQEKKC
eukprot:1144659-Pelagomonas_calceolata.AAC.3